MLRDNSFGIAVIGVGKMGADHVDCIRTRVHGARVVAVVDPDSARAEAVTTHIPGAVALGTVDDALSRNDVDGVLIATPGPAHEQVLYQALERNIPILCEKPLTPDPESAWSVLEAEMKLESKRIQLGFMRRFDDSYTQIKTAIDDNALGALLMLHCAHRNPKIALNFTTDMLLTDSVVHEFDMVRFLAGEEISYVQVRSGRTTGAAEPHLADPQQVLIETESGVLADVEIFVNANYGYQVTTEAVFENGVVNTGVAPSGAVRTSGQRIETVPTTFVGRFGDAYARELQVWVDAARHNRIGGPSAWDGYAAAACCAAGVSSQQTGLREPVRLRPKPDFYN